MPELIMMVSCLHLHFVGRPGNSLDVMTFCKVGH